MKQVIEETYRTDALTIDILILLKLSFKHSFQNNENCRIDTCYYKNPYSNVRRRKIKINIFYKLKKAFITTRYK